MGRGDRRHPPDARTTLRSSSAAARSPPRPNRRRPTWRKDHWRVIFGQVDVATCADRHLFGRPLELGTTVVHRRVVEQLVDHPAPDQEPGGPRAGAAAYRLPLPPRHQRLVRRWRRNTAASAGPAMQDAVQLRLPELRIAGAKTSRERSPSARSAGQRRRQSKARRSAQQPRCSRRGVGRRRQRARRRRSRGSVSWAQLQHEMAHRSRAITTSCPHQRAYTIHLGAGARGRLRSTDVAGAKPCIVDARCSADRRPRARPCAFLRLQQRALRVPGVTRSAATVLHERYFGDLLPLLAAAAVRRAAPALDRKRILGWNGFGPPAASAASVAQQAGLDESALRTGKVGRLRHCSTSTIATASFLGGCRLKGRRPPAGTVGALFQHRSSRRSGSWN